MRAAIINNEKIVTNIILVEKLEDYEGAVYCPDWVNIGDSIDEPIPNFYYSSEYNKEKAIDLLKQTDWVNEPDVYDITLNPHLLNRNEFLTYRSFLRTIAVKPYEGNIDWGIVPKELWSDIT
jgi:hypothetical protein